MPLCRIQLVLLTEESRPTCGTFCMGVVRNYWNIRPSGGLCAIDFVDLTGLCPPN